MSSTNTTAETPNDDAVLRNTLSFYGSLLLIFFVSFCLVRRLCPRPYTIRKWVDEVKTHLADDQFGFFSWVWRLYSFTDDELMNECGMDALCFLRVFRFGSKIAAIGIFNSFWLFAVYATAKPSEETAYIKSGVLKITIANVPPGSPRFIATVVAAYVLFGSTMYLILQELDWYIKARYNFMDELLVRNYTIFCRNVPVEFQNNAALLSFFEKCTSPSSVLQANVCVKTSNLVKVVDQREKVLLNLERAMFNSRVKGINPTHKKLITGEQVESIPAYNEELSELNDDIKTRIEKIRLNMQNYHIPMQSKSGDTEMDPSIFQLSHEQDPLTQEEETDRALRQSNRQESPREKNHTESIGITHKKETSFFSAARSMILRNEDGLLMHSGFVTFTNLSAVHSSLQMIQYDKPFSMDVMAAPEPDDVLWSNVSKTHQVLQIGTLISIVATTALCFFWTIPITFFASLSSVSELRKVIPPINALLDAAPFLQPVFELLAPYLVVVVSNLLPAILIFLTTFEGWISNATVSASAFTKLAAFMIIQTFFVSAISGTILEELKTILNDPKKIVSMLANSLPAQSTYFIQIIFISTVIPTGMELLRVIPILFAFIRGFVGPRTLEKDRKRPFLIFSPLSNPKEFDHAAAYSSIVLYFMVLLVYAVMSPLTPFVVCLCFIYLAAAYRHQFVFIYSKSPDSGGLIYAKFLNVLLVCMLVAEITIVGLLALKESIIGVPLFIPLIVFTVLFISYIRQQHFRRAEVLPAFTCVEADQRNGPMLDINAFRDNFVQPELLEDEPKAPDIDDEVIKALCGSRRRENV